MTNTTLIALVLMAASGVALALQAPLNAMLGRGIGSPLAAATVSFGVGFLVLLLLTLIIGDGASLTRLGTVPIWLLIGGTLGALYVFSALWSVPVLGVLTVTTMLILGQMVAALLLDYFGAFGLAAQELTAKRLLAAALVAGGVVLSRI
ncbi:DMT family transporter [Roseovarius pelagicus]|uniref:DMT family transporter n=1 Tax=Roseovarius pelagicus TaxID=2980108 RepID=A0ABY6DDC3_9RHOB|nr:DMT family transporter [Roseovarius pelagicus]UXX83550.1 DMT family transporter [Roseovarius pelagicus]